MITVELVKLGVHLSIVYKECSLAIYMLSCRRKCFTVEYPNSSGFSSTFCFYLILTAFTKMKFMSQVAHNNWKRIHEILVKRRYLIYKCAELLFDRGDSSSRINLLSTSHSNIVQSDNSI